MSQQTPTLTMHRTREAVRPQHRPDVDSLKL